MKSGPPSPASPSVIYVSEDTGDAQKGEPEVCSGSRVHRMLASGCAVWKEQGPPSKAMSTQSLSTCPCLETGSLWM